MKKLLGLDEATAIRTIEGPYTDVYFKTASGSEDRVRFGNSHGKRWVQYWFGDPQEPFFYRLDWVANMWAISLRHYKEDKSPGDLKRMERIAEFLSKRFAEKRITTAEYRSRRGAAESTCILVDPGRSPGLCHLAKIHRALIDALF